MATTSASNPTHVTPVLLLILDGFGYRADGADNAILLARKPTWDSLWSSFPHATLEASEQFVGLPDGQMGNSEVGHLNIGGGRIVQQELTRIDLAVADGTLAANPVLRQALDTARAGALHLMGLLSEGGVHSLDSHFHAVVRMAVAAGVPRINVHAFLDGRDTPPKSAQAPLARIEAVCQQSGGRARIASLCGRFYAMDRDQRWERTTLAYNLLVSGDAEFSAPDAASGLEQAYARGEQDEFVKPTLIGEPGASVGRMNDGDAVIFMNFRADRARQITRALTLEGFDGFERCRRVRLGFFCSLTSYGVEFAHPVAFPPVALQNSFGEVLAQHDVRQLRIAETEKYPHVTYFFNGGEETPYPGEDRVLVPSPKVATYDLQPEMSAIEVTDKLVEAIQSRRYQAIVCNYANCDMVGHTGSLPATIQAVEALDGCLGRVVSAMRGIGGEVLITADHGNAEMMFDPATGQAHTAHTTNPVPCVYIGRTAQIAASGSLRDIAPTLLAMMGLSQPTEMTGKSLLRFG